MKSADKRTELNDAKSYIALIGKPQHHLGCAGKLHSLEVETQIHHQAEPGSKNYWQSSYFDRALACVIKARFSELANAAIAILSDEYVKARIADKNELLAQLAEIEALEDAISKEETI